MDTGSIIQTVVLSLRVGIIATIINVPIAFGAVFLLTQKKLKGKALLDGMINLPLVMPPVTTGYLLLLVLGKHGVLGTLLYNTFGITIAFSTTAAVIAAMVVSFPLVVRNIKASMEMTDQRLEQAAYTLGAGKIDVFFRVTLPQIKKGVAAGMILGFARCLGEFGATMTFAGNIQGQSRTIPLSVYSFLQIPGKEREAAILVAVSVVLSFGAMLISNLATREHTNTGSITHGA